MTRWFTSDLHFSHENVETGRGIRQFEPVARAGFNSIEHMNETIIENFNSVVKPEDELFILGDVALGKLDESLENIKKLNGTKTLVAGNHDRCWVGYGKNSTNESKFAASIMRYFDAGFEHIFQNTVIKVANRLVDLSHFPYEGDHEIYGGDRFVEWRLKNRGRWLLCGHVHSAWLQRGRQFNVGIDANPAGLFPYCEDEIIEVISQGPQDR